MKFFFRLIIFVAVLMQILTLSEGDLFAITKESKFKISFSERFRFVSWHNTISLSDEVQDSYSFSRNRTSLKIQWFPRSKIELALKLSNEFRKYFSPKSIDFEIHELFFDHLYIKWKNIGKLPLTFTLGRQDIMLGEGFVVMDGHPLDGSRSIYFNAVRADYKFNTSNKLIAFYTYQPTTDDLLPIINDQDANLVDQPEKGLGLYYIGEFDKTQLEVYFIRKDINSTAEIPIESGINTFGARVNIPVKKNLSLTAEASYQFGTYGDVDRNAMGGYFHLDYHNCNNSRFLKKITLGGIYLSGDDPTTQTHESWDPLFSRWPKWSESYIYTLINENGVAYWSNLNSIYASLCMELMERMLLNLTYHRLGANERGFSLFSSGTGKTRGNLFIGRITFEISKKWSSHFVWEHFRPGNFYFNGACPANWLRFELMLKL